MMRRNTEERAISNSVKIMSIGYGAMARSLRASLDKTHDDLALGGCLLSPTSTTRDVGGIEVFTTTADLIAAKPDLVVECATHDAVHSVVPDLLKAGIDVIIVSIGALADPNLMRRITQSCDASGARATVVSGAIGALDVLRAAACAGLDKVTYIGRKPPEAWKGTPAEGFLDLDAMTSAQTFYEGSARAVAKDYPKNTNVTAAVALAGIGFDATSVKLIADPAAKGNTHELEAVGEFGHFRITLENLPLPENPKTSWLAALSVEQAVRRHFSNVEV
jgi:aspartate dehydrogenase